eukprot:COSAG01_NODE_4904_length_4640_cov_3.836159_7_plen_164_part_01
MSGESKRLVVEPPPCPPCTSLGASIRQPFFFDLSGHDDDDDDDDDDVVANTHTRGDRTPTASQLPGIELEPEPTAEPGPQPELASGLELGGLQRAAAAAESSVAPRTVRWLDHGWTAGADGRGGCPSLAALPARALASVRAIPAMVAGEGEGGRSRALPRRPPS